MRGGRVEMWRSGCRLNISVSASFVWRCLSGSALTPFPHPAHRTGHADFPHPALGQDFTPSPTARRAQARLGVRARSAHKARLSRYSRPVYGMAFAAAPTADFLAATVGDMEFLPILPRGFAANWRLDCIYLIT